MYLPTPIALPKLGYSLHHSVHDNASDLFVVGHEGKSPVALGAATEKGLRVQGQIKVLCDFDELLVDVSSSEEKVRDIAQLRRVPRAG